MSTAETLFHHWIAAVRWHGHYKYMSPQPSAAWVLDQLENKSAPSWWNNPQQGHPPTGQTLDEWVNNDIQSRFGGWEPIPQPTQMSGGGSTGGGTLQGSSTPISGGNPPRDAHCEKAATPNAGDDLRLRSGVGIGAGATIARALSTKGLEIEAIREPSRQGYDGRFGGRPAPDMQDPPDPSGTLADRVCSAPIGGVIVGRGTVSPDGSWGKIDPGHVGKGAAPAKSRFRNGVPTGAALQVLPPGYVPDGADDQCDHVPENFSLLLFDGACSARRGAVALAWGSWDTDQGIPVGGPVLRTSGAKGSLDLDILGRDADGNERSDFALNLHGELWADVDGTMRQFLRETARFGGSRQVGALDGVLSLYQASDHVFETASGVSFRVRANGDTLYGPSASDGPRIYKGAADTLEIEADVVRPATAGDALGEAGREWDGVFRDLEAIGKTTTTEVRRTTVAVDAETGGIEPGWHVIRFHGITPSSHEVNLPSGEAQAGRELVMRNDASAPFDLVAASGDSINGDDELPLGIGDSLTLVYFWGGSSGRWVTTSCC